MEGESLPSFCRVCIVYAMCLYFRANLQFAKMGEAHKDFRILLVHAL